MVESVEQEGNKNNDREEKWFVVLEEFFSQAGGYQGDKGEGWENEFMNIRIVLDQVLFDEFGGKIEVLAADF